MFTLGSTPHCSDKNVLPLDAIKDILSKSVSLTKKLIKRISTCSTHIQRKTIIHADLTHCSFLIYIILLNTCYHLTVLFNLLALSNDIESNPGPDTNPVFAFSDLVIAHLNICSLRNKLNQLEPEIPDHCHILCLTETRVDASFSNNSILIPGFTQIQRKDKTCRSGGICVQTTEHVTVERLINFESNDLELLWLRIMINTKSFILGTGYRNPELSVEYWDRLNDNITQVVDRYGSQNLILLGDFNENLLDPQLHHLADLIDSFNMLQILREPTRLTPTSQTLIDPIIVGRPNIVNASGVRVTSVSDHCLTYASLNFKLPSIIAYKRLIYKYNVANWDAMADKLDLTNWTAILNSNNADNSAKIITSIIIKTVQEFTPHKNIRFTNRDKPWITAEIKLHILIRNKLFNKAKRTKSGPDWNTFKQCRNQTTLLIKRAKSAHIHNLVQKMNETSSSDKYRSAWIWRFTWYILK